MIDVSAITELHRMCVQRWHGLAAPDNAYAGFLGLVCAQHEANYLLWHEEDLARDPRAGDPEIAGVKRRIDKLNQLRNDRIEQLDDALVAQLAAADVRPADAAPLNSETPGSAIDRLSILALRMYHMQEQAERTDAAPEHRHKAQQRLAILHQQHRDLAQALQELLADIFAGRKRLTVYRQFKMYNDPALNPRIYNAGQTGRG